MNFEEINKQFEKFNDKISVKKIPDTHIDKIKFLMDLNSFMMYYCQINNSYKTLPFNYSESYDINSLLESAFNDFEQLLEYNINDEQDDSLQDDSSDSIYYYSLKPYNFSLSYKNEFEENFRKLQYYDFDKFDETELHQILIQVNFIFGGVDLINIEYLKYFKTQPIGKINKIIEIELQRIIQTLERLCKANYFILKFYKNNLQFKYPEYFESFKKTIFHRLEKIEKSVNQFLDFYNNY